MLRVLNIRCLQVDDLSPLTKLQNLEEFECWGIPPSTSLTPLEICNTLKKLVCSSDAIGLKELREKRHDIEVSH